MDRILPTRLGVSQADADEIARVIERRLRAAEVERAGELGEEARVRLLRELQDLSQKIILRPAVPVPHRRAPANRRIGFMRDISRSIRGHLGIL